jgi:tetratricopeptide (TPR) repeat protein
MAEARIKFTWGTSSKAQTKWALGLFAIYRQSTAGVPDFSYLSRRAQKLYQKKTVFISVRGVLAWSCALAVVGYFGGAFALQRVQSRRPHNQITYADVALPWRWAGLDALRGRAFMLQAKDEFAAGKFMSGFNLLRLGISKDPGDNQARLDLSQLFIVLRLRSQSDKVLMQAFDYGWPGKGFLSEAHDRLVEGDSPELMDEFLGKARNALAHYGGDAGDERLIDEYAIARWINEGEFERARPVVRRLYPEGTDERSRLEILLAMESGKNEEIVRLANEWQRNKPRDELALAVTAGVYRKLGDFNAMQESINRLRALSPSHPAHATFNVVQNLLAGRDAEARSALEDWFFRFGADERAMSELTHDVSVTGRDDVLERIEAVVREHGFDPRAVLMGRLFVQIKSRDWDRATATCKRIEAIASRMPENDRLAFDVATTLVHACVDAGGGAQSVFIDAFSRSPGSLEFDRMLVDALVACDRIDTAGELLNLVEGSYPESRYVADMSSRVRERRRIRSEAVEASRPVPKESPARSYASGAAFMDALNRLEAQGDPDGALQLIRGIRQADPKWLGDVDEMLYQHELDLAVSTGDLTLLHLTTKNYLRSAHAKRRETLMKRAVVWHKQGLKTESMMVVREILRDQSDYQPALDALESWEPSSLKVAKPVS